MEASTLLHNLLFSNLMLNKMVLFLEFMTSMTLPIQLLMELPSLQKEICCTLLAKMQPSLSLTSPARNKLKLLLKTWMILWRKWEFQIMAILLLLLPIFKAIIKSMWSIILKLCMIGLPCWEDNYSQNNWTKFLIW